MEIMTALETIDTLEELQGFSRALRDPPAGIPKREVTKDEWSAIATKKIRLQNEEQAHAHRKNRTANTRRR